MPKRFLLGLSCLLVLGLSAPYFVPAAARPGSDPELLQKLLSLSQSKDFFALRSLFVQQKGELDPAHRLFFEAVVANAFNHPQESNLAIAGLNEADGQILGDSIMQEIYQLRILNHINLYEYQAASLTTDELLRKHGPKLEPAAIADLENTNKMWSALARVPPQTASRDRDYSIPLTRDAAGLQNVEVDFGRKQRNFIFDTGANFSVIRKSLVKKLGLTRIKSDFLVDAVTGAKVKSDLAVAKKLEIGGMTFENVVFLVFADESLTFPGYEIQGIIGYPVIEAMREIHISKDNQLFVPQELTPFADHNFALDGFLPLISVQHQGEDLLFHFDTGAGRTSLFARYFHKYREQIEGKYPLETFSTGGAGGIVKFEGYTLAGLKLAVGNSEAELEKVRVHPENIGQNENYFHGILGQDFIRKFDKMIISFAHSSIRFE